MQQLSLCSGCCLQLRVSGQILDQQTLGMAMLYAAGLRTLGHAMQATEKAMARLPMAADSAVARRWEWEAQSRVQRTEATDTGKAGPGRQQWPRG